jgi:antitoxin CcdA
MRISNAEEGCVMQTSFNKNAVKKATNLSINEDLLAEARALKINLSATLEHALMDIVLKEKRKQWLDENKNAIQACNDLANSCGLFADKHRTF